jgi:hypothetical protein
MRLTRLAVALVLTAGAAAAAEPIDVMPAIPHGLAVSMWMPRFPDAGARRQADSAARERCKLAGGEARFVRSALMQWTRWDGQKGVYLYDCLR